MYFGLHNAAGANLQLAQKQTQTGSHFVIEVHTCKVTMQLHQVTVTQINSSMLNAFDLKDLKL